VESVADLGRFKGHGELIDGMFDDWNRKLECRMFCYLVVVGED
jgi:hypothetical protein